MTKVDIFLHIKSQTCQNEFILLETLKKCLLLQLIKV